MNFALVGYGRMGREIETIAVARGHRLVAVIDPEHGPAGPAAAISRSSLHGAELAFEFTVPSAAEGNVLALLRAGVGVVCGTTGWDAQEAAVARAARRSERGLVVSPNFSIGMALFTEVVSEASRRFGALGGYDPWILEAHHRGKLDAPSGTSRRLAAIVAERFRSRAGVAEGNSSLPLAPGVVHLASIRAGHEPGVHTVGFDGPDDALSFTHRARGRRGLAAGAVLAAEWLRRRRGSHDFQEVVHSLLRKGRWR